MCVCYIRIYSMWMLYNVNKCEEIARLAIEVGDGTEKKI